MDNLEEIDIFLEVYNLLKLNQGEMQNVKRQLTCYKTESVIIIIMIKNSQQAKI